MRSFRRRLQTLFTLLIAVACSIGHARGQQSTPPQEHKNERVAFTECQGQAGCNGSWIFDGKSGVGTWPTGEKAVLQVTSVSDTQITITRTDIEGTKAGLKATYSGNFTGKEVGGLYNGTYDGQQLVGHWYWQPDAAAKEEKTSAPIPASLSITECEGPDCTIYPGGPVTWNFSGSNGVGAFGTGRQPMHLDLFDGTNIIVTRTDTSGNWLGSAVYTGTINGSKINGSAKYTNRNGTTATQPWTGVIGNVILPQPQVTITTADIYNGIDHLKTAIDIWNFFVGNSN